MPVTPTSSMGLALVALKDALAASASWQSWCGAADAAEAAAHIRYYWRNAADLESGGEAVDGVWPHARLLHEAGSPYRVRAGEGSSASSYSGGMGLVMVLEGLIPDGYTDDEALIDHMNRAEAVWEEVLAGASTLRPAESGMTGNPQRADYNADVQWIRTTWGFLVGRNRRAGR